jgi:hypothetical protein
VAAPAQPFEEPPSPAKADQDQVETEYDGQNMDEI